MIIVSIHAFLSPSGVISRCIYRVPIVSIGWELVIGSDDFRMIHSLIPGRRSFLCPPFDTRKGRASLQVKRQHDDIFSDFFQLSSSLPFLPRQTNGGGWEATKAVRLCAREILDIPPFVPALL